MDVYEDRKGYNNEPLGDYGLKLLALIKAKGGKLIITDLIIKELQNYYNVAEIKGMMKPFEQIMEKIIGTKKQGDKPKKIADERKFPYGDLLHPKRYFSLIGFFFSFVTLFLSTN